MRIRSTVCARTVYICNIFTFLHLCSAVVRNLWIKAAPILLSLLGLPPNCFGCVDSRRRSCSGREWKWAHFSWAVWADFPVAFVISLPSLLWGSEVPQHPVGPMGAETLDQPVERFLFCFLNRIQKIDRISVLLIICMQEVVETNLITSVTSSIWRAPGLFPAGIELLSALCEKGVHLGTSDPAHMVTTPLFCKVWLECVCLLSKILIQHLFVCLQWSKCSYISRSEADMTLSVISTHPPSEISQASGMCSFLKPDSQMQRAHWFMSSQKHVTKQNTVGFKSP